MDYDAVRNNTENTSFLQGKRLRLIAIISSILCVIFLVVIIILAASSSNSSSKEVCKSEECIRSAADIILSMNTSVDPCDDFYRFTCDRWGSQHAQNTAFADVDERMTKEISKILRKTRSSDEPKPVRQSREFFRSCMDEDSRDTLGYEPLFKYLSILGLPAVPRFFNMSEANDDIKNYKFDWIKTDATMNKLLDVQLFVDVDVDKNMYDTTKNTIIFGVPQTKVLGYESLAISSKQHDKLMAIEEAIATQKDSVDEKTVKAHIDLIVFAFSTLISEKYELPFDFKQRLLNALETITDVETMLKLIKLKTGYTTVDHYSKISVADLQKYTDLMMINRGLKPQNLWKKYLSHLFEGMSVSPDYSADVIHLLPEHRSYFALIATYLASESDVNIELWAWWKVVRNLIMHTTTDASEIISKLLSASGLDVKQSREISCARLTKNFMNYAVTYSIADKTFLEKTKLKVETMWNYIKDAFATRVNSLTWMNDKIKKLTIEKSKEMIHNIGFPEWLLDKKKLEDYYASMIINDDTYLNNLVETNKLRRKHKLERLYLKNNNYWSESPMMVNAFNNIFGNIITIPMGMINYPFYNRGLEVLNYGSMASILGHELTHGFDTTGMKYDKHGNYNQWWTHTTILEFYIKALCFVDQYNKFYVPEVDAYVNGTISLGENIADNGGLHHAYLAYQNHKRKMGEEMKLPGLEKYSSNQLFFIAYANTWCNEEDVLNLKISLEGSHCPNKYRVLGNLMNSEEFTKAFNCPVGSKMNPATPKCQIW